MKYVEYVRIPSVSVTAGMCKPCGVSRTFDESGMCLLRGLFLGSLQNSLTEEIKAASAIHLPL
jgi:hypothetical protein